MALFLIFERRKGNYLTKITVVENHNYHYPQWPLTKINFYFVNWGASSRWSFGPNSGWGSIVNTVLRQWPSRRCIPLYRTSSLSSSKWLLYYQKKPLYCHKKSLINPQNDRCGFQECGFLDNNFHFVFLSSCIKILSLNHEWF